MSVLKKTLLPFIVLFVLSACSKEEDVPTPGGSSEPPVSEEQLWTERAEQITEGCTTNYEKAKAIYEWECANIAYDLELKIYTADECWNQRKGVCQAYSDLFVKLASYCDLEAVMITGNSRTLAYMNGDGRHAWVKANTENGWILIDPTWGAGYVSMQQNSFVFYNHNMSWFDADPEVMIFTHFPDDPNQQLLEETVTKDQYKDLPLVEPQVVIAGWNGHEVLTYFLNHPGEPAPLFYSGFIDYLGKFELVQMPYCGQMKVGETYILKIRSLNSAAVPMGNWSQEGNLYTMEFHPSAAGEFIIFLSGNGIMSYEVVN